MSFALLLLAICAPAAAQSFGFTALSGDRLDMEAWRGRPVLVVNTASFCGFTPQYRDMQALHEEFGDAGLVVLAVPSEDFNQEYTDNADVAEFCRVDTGLTFPITQITPVTGAQAHPFYRWLARDHDRAPRWNFNKALIGPDGGLVGFWGAATRPVDGEITRRIRRLLP